MHHNIQRLNDKIIKGLVPLISTYPLKISTTIQNNSITFISAITAIIIFIYFIFSYIKIQQIPPIIKITGICRSTISRYIFILHTIQI